MTLSVLLVDDHELVRSGLAMMINAQPDMRVAAQLGNGAQACHWLRRRSRGLGSTLPTRRRRAMVPP